MLNSTLVILNSCKDRLLNTISNTYSFFYYLDGSIVNSIMHCPMYVNPILDVSPSNVWFVSFLCKRLYRIFYCLNWCFYLKQEPRRWKILPFRSYLLQKNLLLIDFFVKCTKWFTSFSESKNYQLLDKFVFFGSLIKEATGYSILILKVLFSNNCLCL